MELVLCCIRPFACSYCTCRSLGGDFSPGPLRELARAISCALKIKEQHNKALLKASKCVRKLEVTCVGTAMGTCMDTCMVAVMGTSMGTWVGVIDGNMILSVASETRSKAVWDVPEAVWDVSEAVKATEVIWDFWDVPEVVLDSWDVPEVVLDSWVVAEVIWDVSEDILALSEVVWDVSEDILFEN